MSMAATTTALIGLPSQLPPRPFPFISKPRSDHLSLVLFTTSHFSGRNLHYQDKKNKKKKKSNKLWETLATPEEALPLDSAAPLDNAEQIVSTTGDEGVATVIQSLLFVAFVALTILTIGVIYIAVQDFLGKRERDKFEKEEAAKGGRNKKNKKKKVAMRARAGPRGFGQKQLDEDDDL